MNRRRILASLGSHTPTAKDYVQDGLVAMWDGIENDGYFDDGIAHKDEGHWRNLVDGKCTDKTYPGQHKILFESNCLVLDGSWGVYYSDISYAFDSAHSVECCVFVEDHLGVGSQTIFRTTGDAGRGLRFVHIQGGFLNIGQSNVDSVACQITDGDHSFSGSIDQGKLYVDGQYIAPSRAVDYWTGFGTTIGFKYNPPSMDNFFRGKIYAIRCYSRSLSQQEVMQNYAIDKARFGPRKSDT